MKFTPTLEHLTIRSDSRFGDSTVDGKTPFTLALEAMEAQQTTELLAENGSSTRFTGVEGLGFRYYRSNRSGELVLGALQMRLEQLPSHVQYAMREGMFSYPRENGVEEVLPALIGFFEFSKSLKKKKVKKS